MSGGGVPGFPPGQVALLSASSNGGDHLDHLGTGLTHTLPSLSKDAYQIGIFFSS